MRAAVLGFFGRIWSRLLHLHFRLTRGLTLGVRAVVFSSDGRVLLVRHTYTPGWHFPGGGVEVGESAEAALANELWEETGLTLSGKPRLISADFNSEVSERDHVLTYFCETEGEAVLNPTRLEIAELAYFKTSDLPDNINPAATQTLNKVEISKDQLFSAVQMRVGAKCHPNAGRG